MISRGSSTTTSKSGRLQRDSIAIRLAPLPSLVGVPHWRQACAERSPEHTVPLPPPSAPFWPAPSTSSSGHLQVIADAAVRRLNLAKHNPHFGSRAAPPRSPRSPRSAAPSPRAAGSSPRAASSSSICSRHASRRAEETSERADGPGASSSSLKLRASALARDVYTQHGAIVHRHSWVGAPQAQDTHLPTPAARPDSPLLAPCLPPSRPLAVKSRTEFACVRPCRCRPATPRLPRRLSVRQSPPPTRVPHSRPLRARRERRGPAALCHSPLPLPTPVAGGRPGQLP